MTKTTTPPNCNFIDYLRKPKVANISVFDVVATFGVAVLIGYFLPNKYSFMMSSVMSSVMSLWINIIIIFVLLIILGIIVHKLFKIPTMFNYYIGLNSLDAVLSSRKDC
jgi:hypothetical protein